MSIDVHFRSADPHVTHETLNEPIGDRFRSHSHDYCELLLFKRGSASYLIEGRRYSLKPNTLVITHPYNIHRICIEEPEPYERYSVIFDAAAYIPSIYEAIPKSVDILELKDDHPIVAMFDKMDFYYENLDEANFKHFLISLCEELFCNLMICMKQSAPPEVSGTNPIIARAIRYIEDHLLELDSVDELCQALFITKSHLHHLFTSQMQITPKKYILSKRLSLAKDMINSGSKPMSVYMQCGFRNYSTFFRDYKQYFGYPPSDHTDLTHMHYFQD